MSDTYEDLCRRVRELQDQGKLPTSPTPEQKADWAYGNAVIENSDVTMAMARKVVKTP